MMCDCDFTKKKEKGTNIRGVIDATRTVTHCSSVIAKRLEAAADYTAFDKVTKENRVKEV